MSLAKHPSSTVQILGAEKAPQKIHKTVYGFGELKKNKWDGKKPWVGKHPNGGIEIAPEKKLGWQKRTILVTGLTSSLKRDKCVRG